jgi:RNA polymerase sigma-70 factor (ECF subfamily)
MASDGEARQRFEVCIESCAEPLFRVAYRLTGDRSWAEELVQETYLNAWRNLHSLRKPEQMRSWLFSILRNQHSKLNRRRFRLVTGSPGVEQIVEETERDGRETADVVQTALDQLDEPYKLPLLLVAMEGMSVAEAAGILGLPRGTVLSRLHRGRAALKALLQRSAPQLTSSNDNDER